MAMGYFEVGHLIHDNLQGDRYGYGSFFRSLLSPLFLNILYKWKNGETKANANASPESIPSPSLHCLLPMLQKKTQLQIKKRLISLEARMLADNGELLVRLR